MQDFTPKGTGNSRFLKSVSNFKDLYPTYTAFANALIAGTLPIDFNGVNDDGVTQRGTPYNKANTLTDATAKLYGLDKDATLNQVLQTIMAEGNAKVYCVAGQKSGTSRGTRSTAEGIDTHSGGTGCHAEGHNTSASGWYSHAEGEGTKSSGFRGHAEGDNTEVNSFSCHAEGDRTKASGYSCHAEGRESIATNFYSHAEGDGTTAKAYACHAEGYQTTAESSYCHAEGQYSTAAGSVSHAEGFRTEATGAYCHTEGDKTTASAGSAHAEGIASVASGYCSHAGGYYTTANSMCLTAIGNNNRPFPISNNYQIDTTNVFVVGGGTANDEEGKSNCFRVGYTGVWGAGAYNASGADYAEMFEWADGNKKGEDRAGLFVTLDGEKIRIATPTDDYILGIVSGNPSVCGDVYDDQWHGMYMTDTFGRVIWEDVEVPERTEEMHDPEHEGKTIKVVIVPAHTQRSMKLNPKYDGSEEYVPRSNRPEWDAVGLLGKLVAVDDGTCAVNGWATVGTGGKATASAERTKYRVMARLDETHVRLMIL